MAEVEQTKSQIQAIESELVKNGFSLNKIPQEKHDEHVWSMAIILWWNRHKRLPTSEELQNNMCDEWDDPVSVEDAQEILIFLRRPMGSPVNRGEWLNPLNRMIWQRTIKARKTEMTLRNGKKFKLDYKTGAKRGEVWVSPEKGFAPAGWFVIDKVLANDWVTS
jgi:hypothetical protein